MTIYLLRHGETEFNRLGIVQGSGVDTDLNDLGRAQALAFYEYYRHVPFDLVVTSELKRTHQTVAPFLENNIPWLRSGDINEIGWGDHEGKTSTPDRMAVYETMIAEWTSGNLDASLPGGETARQLGQRLSRFVDWVQGSSAKHLLICSHGRTMRALVTLMKGKSLSEMERIKHANTGCYIIHKVEDRFEFALENSLLHLENLLV